MTELPYTPLSIEESVEAIRQLDIIPTMLDTVCRLTGMRFAAVARVTEKRWTACSVLDRLDFGLKPGDDLKLESTICDEIRQHHQPVIFGHASAHPVFSTHHTPRHYGLESYVSVPIITRDGSFFGTLCAIDSQPRDFDEGTIVSTLTLFASLIASNLALETRAQDAEAALQAEVDTGTMRETFLAIVGHDLRSPLQGARLIADELAPLQQTDRAKRLVTHLDNSIKRMARLIDDIMDFARGRLGGGVPMDRVERHDFLDVLRLAVDEVASGHPGRPVVLRGTLERPVSFDSDRMRQLLANLLNNAITYGEPTRPITLTVTEAEQEVAISVHNDGEPIAPDMIDHLFDPFVRPDPQTPRPGLGLGLFIASEIARGHGGAISVKSSQEGGTRFEVRFPRFS
ncbi:signal transduction histidine kinase [Luteibacter sp. 621]|jgi:signal transduction histidine kinase|uniref:GAF domain-containing sensor histidine kinase n=1 Tax=Luteibacter sp. 621 TaxID=3373916 RepID=UPI003D1B0941